jgi:tRNA G18 (ribose-2'-O)-methylase SpoU
VKLVPIADASDPRLADYRNVPDAELLARSGVFVVEGRLVVRRLLTSSRFAARSVMVTEAARAALADLLPDDVEPPRPPSRHPDSADDPSPSGPPPVYVVPQALMNGITGFNMHRGCLAIGVRRADDDWRTVLPGTDLVVVAERIANADNVGAIFRNAAAFGAGGVLLDADSTDPLYRKAIRTSMGAALVVPFARATPWPAALGELRRAGFTLVAMTPRQAAPSIRDIAAIVAGRRTAILVGHEGDGLTPDALGSCEHLARVPMADGVDSINVATAAALGMYEIQRAKGKGERAKGTEGQVENA